MTRALLRVIFHLWNFFFLIESLHLCMFELLVEFYAINSL